MGAVANRAGELFAGIVAEVPFVDVLNTMLDDTLPLTPPEWPEWGNPIESETDFRTILSYSPYDNVAAKDYPAILAMGGLTDPRVTYWEPAKWIARLRATMTGGGPVLLRTNMGAGHGGASGRFNRLDEVAIVYAFALWAVGMAESHGRHVTLVMAGPDPAIQDHCRTSTMDCPVKPGHNLERAKCRMERPSAPADWPRSARRRPCRAVPARRPAPVRADDPPARCALPQ